MASESFPVFQQREGEWTSPSTFLLEGVPIHQFFTQDPAALHDFIVNFQTRADDVFVVSYPKSGMKRDVSLLFHVRAALEWTLVNIESSLACVVSPSALKVALPAFLLVGIYIFLDFLILSAL